MKLDSYAQCDKCGVAVHVCGSINQPLTDAFSRELRCFKCGGGLLWWKPNFEGFSFSHVTPERFYRLVLGEEALEGPPTPEIVAAMLTTYRVEQVLMNGPGIREIHLDCGAVMHLSVSRHGAYVHKITRGTE